MQPIVVDAVTVRDLAARAASALRARGVSSGDRVVLLTPGSPDYLAVVTGCLLTGVVPVPLDPALTEGERRPLLDDADPSIVLDSPSALTELLDVTTTGVELADVPLARPMHYTSGTTGRPKGVFSGVLDETGATALFRDERDFWAITADDTHLVTSPLHHSAPLRFALTTLLCGGSVVLVGPFDAHTWAEAVRHQRPTSTFVVPAHLSRLLAAGLPPTDSFRLLAHAGAACPPAIKRQTLAALPDGSVWEFYGSTEGQFTACSGAEWQARPGTVGRARPGRRLSTDDESRLGRIDDDGYVYLDGRRDDLVISGGVNVYPAEVEAALAELPGVRETAVFGLPDERWGQRVCAAVIGDVDEHALRAWARQRLAPAKRPKLYVTVDDLPRTSTGKVRRLDLPAVLGLDEGEQP